MDDVKIKGWIAIVVAVLFAANIVVGVALYSSMSRLAPAADVAKGLKEIRQDVEALRMEKSVTGQYPYPIERYSLLYNRAVSVLIIAVVLNIALTIWVYRRMLTIAAPRSRTLLEIRDQIYTIKEMVSEMEELDEKGKQAFFKDIQKISDGIEESLKRGQ
jgi:hypothetical protein